MGNVALDPLYRGVFWDVMQVVFVFKVQFKIAISPDSAVTCFSLCTQIGVYEFIIMVNDCQKYKRIIFVVVPIEGLRTWRAVDGEVVAIDCPQAIG